MMTAAVALLAMVSCTDDLGLNTAKQQSDADLTATFDEPGFSLTRFGMYEGGVSPWQAAEQGKPSDWKWVFTKDDQVRVFTLDKMIYNYYNLVSGENTMGQAEFKAVQQNELGEGQTIWALTDAQNVYAVSPTTEGIPQLTYTIPYKYKAENITSGEGEDAALDVRKFPSPFWGECTITDGTVPNVKLNVSLKALTAFLRVDVSELPAGTKYIVLTTHGEITEDEAGNQTEHGFQLIAPNYKDGALLNIKNPNGDPYIDKNSWWGEEGDADPVPFITDGSSEPLAGTFNALLQMGVDENGKKVYPALGVDKGNDASQGLARLNTRDELIIDVQEAEENVFWVPLIAQHYDNLHVLAVVEKSHFAYRYVGTELQKYSDLDVVAGDRLTLTMSMLNLGEVCAHELNKAIHQAQVPAKTGAKRTNIINVEKLIPCAHTYGTPAVAGHIDDNLYPNDQIFIQGDGNLVLNIKEISDAEPQAKGGLFPVLNNLKNGITETPVTNTLFVSDKNYGNKAYADCQWRNTAFYAGLRTPATSSVVLNLPANWAKAATTEGPVSALMSDLPLFNATIAANVDGASAPAKNLTVYAHTALTEFVSGHNLEAPDGSLKDAKGAALTVVNGLETLNILEESKGDVYIDGNNSDLEISNAINVYTKAGINLRMDNALAKDVMYQTTSNKDNYLLPTGSSAIQKVSVIGDETDAADLDNALPKPNKVFIQSYWTGYALNSGYDGIKAYDNGRVYTVAQLASMGEKINTSETNTYKIQDLVTEFWLGGSKYPWLGAQVIVENFEFDGNNKSLQNMNMPELAGSTTTAGKKIYVYDPHLCCTSCGWDRQDASTTSHTDNEELKSFGLIRSISKGAWNEGKLITNFEEENATTAIIKNVNLNDVQLEAKADVDNIGSILGFGRLDGTDGMNFYGNRVGEVKIDVDGDFVGGMAGKVIATNLNMEKEDDGNGLGNSVTGNTNGSGYINGGNYVGGLVGYADVRGMINIQPATVSLSVAAPAEGSEDKFVPGIVADGDYAGGIFGGTNLEKDPVIIVSQSNVSIKGDGKISAENLAGGIAGGAKARSISLYTDDVYVKNNIEASDADYAAGFIGKMKITSAEGIAQIDKASITVDGAISAAHQFAGGMFGQTEAPNVAVKFLTGDITVNEIVAEDGYAGGVIAQSSTGDVIIAKDVLEANSKDINEINIDVEKLSSAYAAGGVVGNNENNSDVTINAFFRATSQKYGNFVNIDINAFENTKADDEGGLDKYYKYSGNDANAQLAGTMSNIIGQLGGNLTVFEKNLTVVDNLQSDMKADVGYKNHPDRQQNKPTSLFFWGDYNGYVGWGNSGNYFISTNNYGNGGLISVTADQEDGYNLYKNTTDYAEKSKNAPTE